MAIAGGKGFVNWELDFEVLECIRWQAVIVDECKCTEISKHFEQIIKLFAEFRVLLFNGQLKRLKIIEEVGAGHMRVIQVVFATSAVIYRSSPLSVRSNYSDFSNVTYTGFLFKVRKGDTIGEFLRAVQQQLAPEFREIRTSSVENLLYVKEDLIIPHVT
ncbi:hypothetical protein U1Q18_018069 [Sarracenia purpurea var. burkii]